MPLRDHFRPPPSDPRSREGFHGGWPMMIVAALGRSLPRHYAAEPQVHLGPSIEIDVVTHEGDDTGLIATGAADEGGVAIAAGDTRPSMSGLCFKFNVPFWDLKSLAFRRPLQYVGVIVGLKERPICVPNDE